MPLILLKYNEINKAKWDECIENAKNALIYACSFYLDNITQNTWQAIIEGDYEAVMPICSRKKYGIEYLYQPPFAQQGGIFSAKEITKSSYLGFIEFLQQNFRFVEINLNYGNIFEGNKLNHANNFILDLSLNYTSTCNNYKNNFTKNIKRAAQQNFTYKEETSYKAFIQLYKKLYAARMPQIKEYDYEALAKNCEKLQGANNLVLRKAIAGSETYAAAILLKHKNRLYNIASSVTEAGKHSRANYFLFDNIIKEFSGQQLIMDFEGSDIQGIADFYRSMGAVNQPYPTLKYNNLPWAKKYLVKAGKFLRNM